MTYALLQKNSSTHPQSIAFVTSQKQRYTYEETLLNV